MYAESCMGSYMSKLMTGQMYSNPMDRMVHLLLPIWSWMRSLKLAANLPSSFQQQAATFTSSLQSQTVLCWTYLHPLTHHKEVSRLAHSRVLAHVLN